MTIKLLTLEEAAAALRLDTEKFLALRKRHGWPAVKLGRYEYRFTEDQLAEIVEKHTEMRAQQKPAPVAAGPLPGQTARSAARSR